MIMCTKRLFAYSPNTSRLKRLKTANLATQKSISMEVNNLKDTAEIQRGMAEKSRGDTT
jgi:hypothetical protein